MKISIPITNTDGESLTQLVYTNVIDTTPVFDPTEQVSLIPKDIEYQYNDKIYKNSEDVTVVPYDALYEDTYQDGDVIYKDGTLTEFNNVLGLFKKQPADYTVPQNTGYDHTTWDTRYTKLQNIPSTFNGYESYTISPPLGAYDNKAMRVSPNGLKAFTLDTNGFVHEYSMTEANNFNTLESVGRWFAISQVSASLIRDMYVNPAGTKLFIVTGDSAAPAALTYVLQYSLSDAWDLSSIITYQKLLDIRDVSPYTNHGTGTLATSIEFSDAGTSFFITWNGPADLGPNGQTITERFTVSTAFDLRSTVTYSSQFGILPPAWTYSTNPNGVTIKKVRFANSGTEILVTGGTWYHYGVYRYTLSVAYNMASTRTLVGYAEEPDQQTARDIYITPDGLNMYFLQYKELVRYHFPVAFDVSQSIYTGKGWFPRYMFDSPTRMRYYRVYAYLNYTTGYNTISQHYDLTRGSASVLASSSGAATVYELVTNDSVENKATIFDDGDGGTMFRINTLLWTEDGIYIRTHIDTQAEFDELDTIEYTPIVEPTDINSFYYLTETNKFRPFDNKNYTYATSDVTMTYIVQGNAQFDTLALGNVKASHINAVFRKPDETVITTIDSDIDTSRDTHGHLPAWYTTIVMYSDEVMPVGSSVEITLTITGSTTIELATLLLGISAEAGFTNLSLRNEYKDFSNFEYDTWGNVDYTERAKVSRYSGTVDIPITSYDMTDRLMTSLGQNLVIVNGSDDGSCGCDSYNIFNATQKIGRFTSFSQQTKIKDDEMDVIATYSFTLEEIV